MWRNTGPLTPPKHNPKATNPRVHLSLATPIKGAYAVQTDSFRENILMDYYHPKVLSRYFTR